MFMRNRRWLMAAGLSVMTSWVAAGAQRPQTTLPLDPVRERGTSVTPAYEGWYPNPDGSFSLLIGYTTVIPRKPSTFRWGRITASNQGDRIKASRRTSRLDASGVSL